MPSSLSLSTDTHGIATLCLDAPESPVNVFTEASIQDMTRYYHV